MDGRLLVRIGSGWESRAAGHLGEVGHPLEVPEDEGGVRLGLDSLNRQVPGQEPAGTGGVDQEVGLEMDGLFLVGPREAPATAGPRLHAVEIHLFQDLDAGFSSLQHQVMIHVLPQPVGVRDGVRGARGHQEAALVGGTVGVGAPRRVAVEGEPPLEASAQVGEALFPPPPGGQGVEVVEAVARGETLQADRGERGGGFAEGEAGVPLAVEEEHAVPLFLEDAREDRSREAGADDGDLHRISEP